MSLNEYFEPRKTKIKRLLKDTQAYQATEPAPKRKRLEPLVQSSKKPLREKFNHLLTPSQTLILPTKYEILLTAFNAVETTVSLMYNRKEDIYLDKIMSSVERLTKKTFNERVMGQIKAAFPSAYSFSRTTNRKILVKPNFEDEPIPSGKFTLKLITTRKLRFRRSLFETTFEYHKEYLGTLENPLHVDILKIQRWHPKFKIESIPAIEPIELIEEDKILKKTTTAAELAQKDLPLRIKEVVTSVASSVPEPPKQSTPLARALSGLPAHLVAKVRENQGRKMAGRANVVEGIGLQKRLATFVRIMRSVFVTERKTSLLRERLVGRLMETYDGMLCEEEIGRLISMSEEKYSEWVRLFCTSEGSYVSVDKNIIIND